MKRYILVAAALSLSFLLLMLPSDSSTEAASYDSPNGEYTYNTHGTGVAGDEYWSNITGFRTSDKYVTIQPALEGYVMVEISSNSFSECDGMTDLILPKTLKRIGPEAFTQCKTLERIYFLGDRPDIDATAIPSGVELYHLSGTSGWDSETSVLQEYTYNGAGHSIGYYIINGEAVINSLKSGKEITIPSTVNTGNGTFTVTTVGNESFRGTSITSIDMADTVTKIGVRVFYGCSELVNAIMPSSLKVVCDEAFRLCPKLNNVDLHNAEYIGFESFRMCYSFTEVIIPDSVTIMHEGAFRVCTSVVSLTIGAGITDIPNSAFDYYYSLENIEVRGKIRSIGDNAFSNILSNMAKLKSISFPDVEKIGKYAFHGSIELAHVDLGDNLKEIGAYAFYDCRSIESLHLPNTVEKIGDSAFFNARDMTDIYFAGNMPEFGSNVFGGTEVLVHCTESHKRSWSGFDGELVVDPDGSLPTTYIVAAIVMILVISSLIILWRRRSGRDI